MSTHFLVRKPLSLRVTVVNTSTCCISKCGLVNLITAADTFILCYNNQQYEMSVVTKLLGDLIHKLSAGSLNCENELSVDASLSSSI